MLRITHLKEYSTGSYFMSLFSSLRWDWRIEDQSFLRFAFWFIEYKLSWSVPQFENEFIFWELLPPPSIISPVPSKLNFFPCLSMVKKTVTPSFTALYPQNHTPLKHTPKRIPNPNNTVHVYLYFNWFNYF